jgi:hypothetical protein
MSRIDSTNGDLPTQPDRIEASDRVARAGLVICSLGVLGLIALMWYGRSTLQARLGALEERTTQQLAADIQTLQDKAAKISEDLQVATDRLDLTRKELAEARTEAEALQRAQTRTARTAASNTRAVKTAKDENAKEMATVNARVTDLVADVNKTAFALTATRSEVADQRREVTAVTAKLSDGVKKNADAVADLRRKGERDVVEFDVRKPSRPESWTVGDIRVELRKADVKHAKYDIVLHVDDLRLERKDLTVNQPVPFLVGPDRARYELVVTSVERDRIRGYVTKPKDRALAERRLGPPLQAVSSAR